MRIADRMSSPPSSPPRTIQPDAPYYDALAIMQACKVGHLPVVDDSGALLGMVSESGLAVVAARYLYCGIEVGEVMERALRVVTPQTPIEEAAASLASGETPALPIVDAGRVVGVLTWGDVVRALLDAAGEPTDERRVAPVVGRGVPPAHQGARPPT